MEWKIQANNNDIEQCIRTFDGNGNKMRREKNDHPPSNMARNIFILEDKWFQLKCSLFPFKVFSTNFCHFYIKSFIFFCAHLIFGLYVNVNVLYILVAIDDVDVDADVLHMIGLFRGLSLMMAAAVIPSRWIQCFVAFFYSFTYAGKFKHTHTHTCTHPTDNWDAPDVVDNRRQYHKCQTKIKNQ